VIHFSSGTTAFGGKRGRQPPLADELEPAQQAGGAQPLLLVLTIEKENLKNDCS